MFSDLVGSTALSARMDPEDLREVISAYQNAVATTVQRFGGFVAKYMGDGVLVYFGYPQAHEDDAERAVRAGLELIAAVAAFCEVASYLQSFCEPRQGRGNGQGNDCERWGRQSAPAAFSGPARGILRRDCRSGATRWGHHGRGWGGKRAGDKLTAA